MCNHKMNTKNLKDLRFEKNKNKKTKPEEATDISYFLKQKPFKFSGQANKS